MSGNGIKNSFYVSDLPRNAHARFGKFKPTEAHINALGLREIRKRACRIITGIYHKWTVLANPKPIQNGAQMF